MSLEEAFDWVSAMNADSSSWEGTALLSGDVPNGGRDRGSRYCGLGDKEGTELDRERGELGPDIVREYEDEADGKDP